MSHLMRFVIKAKFILNAFSVVSDGLKSNYHRLHRYNIYL